MIGLAQVATPALEWALTYLLHSTILLVLTGLVTARWVRSDMWRETLWRGALLGPLVTATLVTTLALPTATGRLEVPGLAPEPAGSVGKGARGFEAWRDLGGSTPASGPEGQARPAPADAAGGWSGTALLLWGAGAGAFLSVLLFRNLTLFRRLRGRRVLDDGPLPAMLAEIRRQAGIWRPIRLSVSDSCATPLVIGATEICIPPRFLDGLERDAQRAALAHEIAHVRRRDPEWQLATGLLGAILFFQPLNLFARLRLREASEHLCDDWTVRQTGSAVSLGRCLTEIASWTMAGPPLRLGGTPAMAEGGSPLLHRIRRIAAGVPAVPERRRWAALAVVASLVTMAVAAPVMGGSALPEAGNPEESAVAGRDTLETIRMFEELAMEDASPQVRQEAAAQLSDFAHAEATNALSRIVRSAPDPVVRAEAAQQLDEFPTGEVVAVLLEVIFEEPVADVREEAFFTLEDFQTSSARAALRRLVREHPLPEVRRVALSALSGEG